MKVIVRTNEFGENYIILSLSAEEAEKVKDGSGCAYAFKEQVGDNVYDLAIVKE